MQDSDNTFNISGCTEKEAKRLKKRFSLLQFTFWCSWCAFTSFVALYLKDQGLSQPQIGFALSVSTLSGIAGQFFWGYLCDRFRTIRWIFLAANLIIGLTVLSFLMARGTLYLMILMGILGFAQVPQPSILDTWILKKMPKHERDYGSIRLWASIGFALFALGFGKAIAVLGFPVLFIAPTLFIAITLFLAWTTSDIDKNTSEKTGKADLREATIKILHDKKFLFFIAVCFLIGLAARTTHLLLPLILVAVRGDASHLGLSLFITGMTEIPMLLLSRRLAKKRKPQVLILLSAILYSLQFLLLYLATSPVLVFAAMVFQGLAFGNLLPSIRLFVYENAPEALRTTAQTITDAITSSLTGVIGSAAGGIIIHQFSLHTLIWILIGLVLAAIVLILLWLVLNGKHKDISPKA